MDKEHTRQSEHELMEHEILKTIISLLCRRLLPTFKVFHSIIDNFLNLVQRVTIMTRDDKRKRHPQMLTSKDATD